MNLTETEIKQLNKQFPYVSERSIEAMSSRYTVKAWLLRALEKANAAREAELNAPDIEHLAIDVYWAHSQSYGMNPSTYASVRYTDGTYKNLGKLGRASGCGYDKESTAVSYVFDKVCKGMLWKKRNTPLSEQPYGVRFLETDCYFMGGVGMESYYDIVRFLGGTMEKVASTKTYDKYIVDFTKP